MGIILGLVVTGPLLDWGAIWMSKRNKGVYEPEFRLIFMVSMLFGVFGYVGWAGMYRVSPFLEKAHSLTI